MRRLILGAGISPFIRRSRVAGAASADPLQDYYSSGTMIAHLTVDDANTSGANIVGLNNKGGSGATYDATVTGSSIATTGTALQMVSGSGDLVMAGSIDMNNRRLMVVVGTDELVNNARFGSHAGANSYEIVANINASGLIVQARKTISGVTTTLSGTVRTAIPATGNILIEMEYTPTQWDVWINGTISQRTASTVTDFFVSALGVGVGGGNRFIGRFGDFIAITRGQADSAAAISAARAYLNDRYSIGLTL